MERISNTPDSTVSTFACAGDALWDSVLVADDSVVVNHDLSREFGERVVFETPLRPGRLVPTPNAPLQSTPNLRALADLGTPTPGAVDYRFVIKEVTGDGALRTFAYCANKEALSLKVKRLSDLDVCKLSSAKSSDDFTSYDDVEIAACIAGEEYFASDEPTQVYHVKAYDVVHYQDTFDVLVVMARQVSPGLSGVTSLCDVVSSREKRRMDIMDYSIQCVGLSAVPLQTEQRVKNSVNILMANYGGSVPLRALHANSNAALRIREIIVDNDSQWFFASKRAIVSFMDRARALAVRYDETHPLRERSDSGSDDFVATRTDMGIRTHVPSKLLALSCVNTSYVRRGIVYRYDLKSHVGVFPDPERLISYRGDDRSFWGHLRHMVVDHMGVLLIANGAVNITSSRYYSVAAYDAVVHGDTWDVNIIMISSETSFDTAFTSSWAERRMSYSRYLSDASSAARYGGVARVTLRDSAILELHNAYTGFLPIRDMAANMVKPIVIRECIIECQDAVYSSYLETNSFLADLRILGSR